MVWNKTISSTGFVSYTNDDSTIVIRELVNKWGEPSIWGVWKPPTHKMYRAESLREAKQIAAKIANEP